ncbi:Ferredoxin [Methanosarcinaceae archaeon Ag5]|uniref:Ferredoxin n=1 Tax=Methanolapillus africanus TaxID=3028297 RepID=A0AAE4MK75_9EURY|nr:Ferredoxin [Methanosarcinaceae archaeon Ag5]
MPAIIDENECTGCGLCVDECPAEAITLLDIGVSRVDPAECTECGACVDVCPVAAITLE